jgi:anti-sigma factor RsiW
MNCDVDPNWLDAYVDQCCSAEEREGIEAHLRNCNGCAVEALNRMNGKRAVRAAANRYAPSVEFRQKIEASLRSEPISREFFWGKFLPFRSVAWLPQLVTAGVALLLIVVSGTLWTQHERREQALVQLLDMHVATTASSNPVDVVSTDRHTVKPWFQGKLPYAFNLPELQNTPYKLVGGKLVYFRNTAGAQLLFELRKHQISVFIFQDQPGMSIATGSAQEKGFSAESWSEAGLRYTLIGDTTVADLHQLGNLIQTAAH